VNRGALRVLYEVVTRLGLNPSLKADVPDTRLIELAEGPDRLTPGRALDLGCGAGRNTIYLAGQGWDVIGIDVIGDALDKARSRAVGATALPHFLLGDVTRLGDLDIGDDYSLIVDSGCYYGLGADQRDGFAAGVTRVAAPGALLLMSGFTKMPGTPAFDQDDLRRRLPGWELRASTPILVSEIERHTSIPFPLRVALHSGRTELRRFELTRPR
jgi:SAM-dependent methyltransferase